MEHDALQPDADLHALLADQTAITVGTAESCTGGHIGARIVNHAGSSAYFRGGIIAYANDVKEDVLGVDPGILETDGAVSERCAIAMATGARRVLDTTIAVSTTGIAGPSGGSDRKPVGIVYIGIATADITFAERHVFDGDRAAIIRAAADRAITLLADHARALRGPGDGTDNA